MTRGSGYVTVDVDVDDIIGEIRDAALIEEYHTRKLYLADRKPVSRPSSGKDKRFEWDDFADELRRTFVSGDALHLEVMIVRMLALAGLPHEMTGGLKA